ncbi:MAG: hypothetical protein VYC56_04760 [Actinomycetota bacterium]|nr:hypothetical protein [Actinomycetota bacterium]MEC9395586.1 hypothetical protein [Actinomycetota bacterium]MED6328051.1 hypothetical protein [Actinomycetota bacterium]MEE2957898.1 hypothetical protein [Actinomycetota bacterium]
MTVARGVRLDLRRAIAFAVIGLAGAVGALVLVLRLAGSSEAVDVKLGDPDFRGIDATDLAAEIAERGPVPFPDLVGHDLPIWVTHSGGDPRGGWAVFSARVPGSEDCLVQWDPHAASDESHSTSAAAGVFYDGCDSTTTWSANGAGLDALPWTVIGSDDGPELRIDLHGSWVGLGAGS